MESCLGRKPGIGTEGFEMKIEILGAGPENKGAYLMLMAVIEKLSRSLPDASFAIRSKKKVEEWNPGELNLFLKPPLSENPVGNLALKLRYGRKTDQRRHMILDPEIDMVLDASGFKYSDQFGALGTWRRAKRIARWKKSGKKVVLLPQAFGPFEIPRVRESIELIADHADLICPRDQESFDHLVKVLGHRDNIKIFPDFTNTLPGSLPEYFHIQKPRTCLVPNTQMILKTPETIKKSYVPFFCKCARYLKEIGLNPFILLHDVPMDRPLAAEISEASGFPLEIIEDENPLYLKGIIGSCQLLVGSRFHSLISALSQGVPAIATGWSHKYEHLFKDYGCPEFLISNLDFEAEALPKLNLLTGENYREGVVSTLIASSRVEKQKTEQMWTEVEKILSA